MQLLINEEFLPKAIELVLKAHNSIDISTFKAEMTTKPRGRRLKNFFDTVIEKTRLGIPVRFLITKRESYGHVPLTNLFAVRELKANRVKVRHLRNDRLCHAKIIIVDGIAAIIGSHNLSIKSCSSNFECSVYIDDISTVFALSSVFTNTFENAKTD